MWVKIFLFGRFEVCRDGELLSPTIWKNAKTQALLKILASDRGKIFSTDELIEYLWSGEELDLRSASSNLRNRVAELRKLLEPELTRGEASRYILTQRGGYLLSADVDCWVDAEEFTRCEEAGRRHQREGQFDQAIEAFEKAVALYRGDYLCEDRYEDWALQLQERWRERLVEVLSLLADCLARRGRYHGAIQYLERALERSALHETLYRQLMVCAFRAGDLGLAHKAYERCRETLERELGERPSSQTEEIYKQVKSGKIPGLEKLYPEPTPERLVALPQKIQRLPFIGRCEEWQALTTALQRTLAGEGRIVLIVGEAGVGKTRLGEEFLIWAKEKLGARTLVGHCYELESPLALGPWLEALRSSAFDLKALELADLSPSWLAELLPELRRAIPDLPSAMALPAEHRPYRLFETLSRILSALATKRAPIVLLLDDLQWADAMTLDFLCYLLEKLARLPLLIVGTLRPEEVMSGHGLERLRHQALRLGQLDELHLARLRESELQDLVKSLADELEATADFGGRLYQESAGSPLFVTAVLQALFENGAFVSAGDHWRLGDLSVVKLPSRAVGLIERRVTRVSAAARRVLQIVACAVQVELEVLEQAWEGTAEELFVHLTELVSQGLLVERVGHYEFAHDKFREVVYESLEGPRRIWLHRKIAQALEQVYPDPATIGLTGKLAYHYEQGEQPQQALEWLLKAMQECQRHYQMEEGYRYTVHGLDLLKELEGRLPQEEYLEQEFELLDVQVQLQMPLGQLSEAESNLEKLFTLAVRLEDDRRKARVSRLRAWWSEWVGQYSEALKQARQAQELYHRAGNQSEQATGLYEVGLAYFCLGDYHQAIKYYEQASVILRGAKEQQTQLINVLDCLGNTYTKLGKCQRALEYYQQELDLCRDIGHNKIESDLLNNRGVALRTLGLYQEALEHFQRACAMDKEAGNRLGFAYSLSNLGQTYRLLGLYRQALEHYQQAHSFFSEVGDTVAQGLMERLLGNLYRNQGELTQARIQLEMGLAKLQSAAARAEEAECMRELSEVLFAGNGSRDQAVKLLEQALKIAQELRLSLTAARCWKVLSEIFLAEQKPEKALEAYEESTKLLSEHEIGGESVIQAHYQHYRVLKALGRPEAQDALRKAHDELQKTAQQITDESLRTSFLNIPLHREILQACRDST